MFVRAIILILFCSFMIYAPKNFFKMNCFNLKKINIENNSKMLYSELTTLSKNLYNRNKFDIDYEAIKNFFRKDIRVKDIEIEDVDLGEINISIEEEDFLYYAILKNKIYLVKKNGQLFGFINEREKKSLPLIVANTQEEVSEITKLSDKIIDENLLKEISQIYKVSDNDYRFILLNGMEVKTNFQVEEEKYKILRALYSEMNKDKKIDYIDLRFEDYIIKYKGDL